MPAREDCTYLAGPDLWQHNRTKVLYDVMDLDPPGRPQYPWKRTPRWQFWHKPYRRWELVHESALTEYPSNWGWVYASHTDFLLM